MRNPAIWVMVLALTATCVAGPKQMNPPAKAQFGHEEISATRDLSPEQYNNLRVSALSMARVKIFSKLNNPSLSQNGVERKIMAALSQQRAYLLERIPAVAKSPLTELQASGKNNPHQEIVASKSTFAGVPVRTGASAASTCKNPQIRSVNGKLQNAVFTPQLPDNVYRIEGCMFGSVPGQIQLEPHPISREQPALPIRLLLKPMANSWSDTEIDAYLDDHLAGVLDAPVTLVIFPGKGQRVELPGCFFVARRGEPTLLDRLPASWVKLQATTTAARVIKQLEYVSPPRAEQGIPSYASGASALVLRSDSTPFEAGIDVFELSHLNSGWKVETVQLQHYIVSCLGDVVQARNSGRWDATWSGEGVKVSWAADSCKSYIPPHFNFELSTSLYALNIWVVGPTGTEPIGTK